MKFVVPSQRDVVFVLGAETYEFAAGGGAGVGAHSPVILQSVQVSLALIHGSGKPTPLCGRQLCPPVLAGNAQKTVR